jgi:hypothetical protein
MLRCADSVGKGGRDFVPASRDMAGLPIGQPELHEKVHRKGRQEGNGHPMGHQGDEFDTGVCSMKGAELSLC